MKIKITHEPAEEEEAANILAALLTLFPRARVRKTEKPPMKHVYLTIRGRKGG